MKHQVILRTLAVFFLSLCGHGAIASPAADGYPPYVTEKKLHATNDLRGKKTPTLQVAEWVDCHAPKTEGKVVLLEFWATWCPDCHRARPILNNFAEKFGDDLAIIGISDESVNVIKKFLDNNPVKFSIASAPDKKMYKEVGVTGIPLVLVVSADGIVRWEGYIDAKEDSLTEEKLAAIIKTSKQSKAK
jgi:thiol-disulfide isomerase/thioredoxin